MVSKNTNPFLLVVDDDEAFLDSISKLFSKRGFRVQTASNGASALEIIDNQPIAVALVDVRLPDVEGPDLLQQLLAQSPSTRCIALTAYGSAQVAADMLNAGARDYFTKPVRDMNRLDQLIRAQFDQWNGQHAPRSSLVPRGSDWNALRNNKVFQEMKGNSPVMRALIQEVMLKGALASTPVLIRGESGTGKELVAQALHHVQHGNKERPFVEVNCAAIPHELFESELFGHESGSFTGASQRRTGLCASAAGGTLFLDEVGEMPLVLQAKLLRVLEQRTYRRVGSDRIERLEARVIAATNIDLEQAIKEGRFREDLYYRLSGQEILVPPLRRREADIHLLAYHFVDKYNQQFGRSVTKISQEALVMLEKYDWRRNNVRELDREIQRALVYCTDVNELPAEFLFRNQSKQQQDRAADSEGVNSIPLGDLSPLLEMSYKDASQEGHDIIRRWFLMHHLQQANWNKAQVARNARMQRGQITGLMAKLGIEEPE